MKGKIPGKYRNWIQSLESKEDRKRKRKAFRDHPEKMSRIIDKFLAGKVELGGKIIEV